MERNKKISANKMRNRHSVNMTSVFVTVLFMCVAISMADINFTTRIKGISADLGRALKEVMNMTIEYSPLEHNVTYISNVEYNPTGMAGLYNVTHIFMDLIQPKEIFPKEFNFLDDNGNLDLGIIISQWQLLLKHYAGLLALTIIGILFAVLMPFVGFIFCCCRCCGNCGARSQPFDKKHDMCKKVLLSMFLIVVATLILFGVVCAFVSNQHMQDGTVELPDNIRDSLTDVKTYMNHTNSQMKTLLIKNFNELKMKIFSTLDNAADEIESKLIQNSNATSFNTLVEFVRGLKNISTNLSVMKNQTNDLRIKASQLNDGLRRVKHELLHTLRECSDKDIHPKCNDLNENINKMSTTVDFDNLPDVTKQVDELGKIIHGGLLDSIEEGQKQFDEIPKTIHNTLKDHIPNIKNSIDQAAHSLRDGADDATEMVENIIKAINTTSKEPIDTADHMIQEYSWYRYYVGIFMSSILLIVILCVTLGLMCGICGKRPDGYDDDCCNKGAGSRFLMLGVAVMFLFSIILMLLTLVYFLSGVIVQRLACDTLRNPNDSRVFMLIDQSLNLTSMLNANLGSVIQSCHGNQSAYTVFHLETKLNMSELDSYIDKFDINGKMEEIEHLINIGNIDVLSNDTKKHIEELKNSGIDDLHLSQFTNILQDNLTSINLEKLANQLGDVAKDINNTDIKMSITQNQMYLNMYQTNLVKPMTETALDLKDKALQIEEHMKFGGSDFSSALNNIVTEITNAQEFINVNGTKFLKEIVKDIGKDLEKLVRGYLNLVKNGFKDDVGKCGPLSNVYNNTLVATCDKIMNPWNGFWLSVGWCLILFIPTIVLSVKLASLYQKSDPYPGPLVEHEYLYDAYADRDNIPLSNSSGKKGKKKKKQRGGDMGVYESRGYPNAAGGRSADPRSAAPRERDAPGGSSHPETRYADMAPKHWEDYPNGGPPQYQSAPLATEYERPPPYYYPGPGDRP